MTDLGREIESSVRADWDDARARAAAAGMRLRRRRRVVARATLATVAAFVLGGWAAWHWRLRTHAPAPLIATQAAPAPSTTLRFDDGSTATPATDDSQLRLASVQPGRVVVEVVSGSGRFDVMHDAVRSFRVEAGRVVLESFGAKFAVARFEDRARVDVVEGTVHVLLGNQQRQLAAGESGVFPPEAPSKTVEPKPRRSSHAASGQPSWRDLAHDGDYDRAYEVLTGANAPPVRDIAEELLLAADVKRLSHHPAEAVAPLRQILRDHTADPRASLAAFTLGRVLLEELGRPREAADAFAQAESLAPDGPMAEDAVARSVEAWSRAGDATQAHRLAEDYLRRYPGGRKVRSVRRFGGLE